MNKAIEGFSDEEKSYAEAGINAFNKNPMEGDVDAIVGKIYAAIGKKAKEDAGVESEQNSLSDIGRYIQPRRMCQQIPIDRLTKSAYNRMAGEPVPGMTARVSFIRMFSLRG